MQVYDMNPLFEDVQEAKIFTDGKTFVDCVPRRNAKAIVEDYLLLKNNPALKFSLKNFVAENFEIPVTTTPVNGQLHQTGISNHIEHLWNILKRSEDTAVNGSSLLALPHPYIVPGGRFREIYYWDSYFTMLGLKESGELETIRNMIDNFSFLIHSYGHIPNGNRSYYLSRSQPPFFALMVELYTTATNHSINNVYADAIEKEYAYWMDGYNGLTAGNSYKKIVCMPDGSILNRYFDELFIPRQESWLDDVETASKSSRPAETVYNHLRSAAESGWDFSSRWLADEMDLSAIETSDIIPVDLNALLYHTEKLLAAFFENSGNIQKKDFYHQRAKQRFDAIQQYCYCKEEEIYYDYHWKNKSLTKKFTPASFFPLWLDAVPSENIIQCGRSSAEKTKKALLSNGGVLTTTVRNQQQWDAPNGWAPLQWITVRAFEKSGQAELAEEIARRWLKLNEEVFSRTGKLMEKYNVVDTHLEAGGGEYEGQDGFGWTNGVYLALKKKYPA